MPRPGFLPVSTPPVLKVWARRGRPPTQARLRGRPLTIGKFPEEHRAGAVLVAIGGAFTLLSMGLSAIECPDGVCHSHHGGHAVERETMESTLQQHGKDW